MPWIHGRRAAQLRHISDGFWSIDVAVATAQPMTEPTMHVGE
jgi:hypothetical protein